MTTYGTAYFKDLESACTYYDDYHYPNTFDTVMRKLNEGEIHIGKPTLKPGQTCFLIDNGTRYAIQEKEST